VVAYDGFDPAEEGRREALCTLGNGYFATRGCVPESTADGVHYPGTYAAGCYNRLDDKVSDHVVENESLVNLPNWLPLSFAIDDGDWLDLTTGSQAEQRHELDLRRGVLTRHARFRDSQGRLTGLVQRRFVHMERPHLAGIETTITAVDWAGRLRIRAGIDGKVENAGVQRYRNLSGRHLVPVTEEQHDHETLLLVAVTSQSLIRVALAARIRVYRNGQPCEDTRQLTAEPGRIAHELDLPIAPGDVVTIEKVVALYTGRDLAISEPAVAAIDELAAAGGFDALLERHVLAWAHLWQRFRVDLRDGYPRGRETIRLHTFHLLQTVSPHSADLDAGLPARGLHGEAYRGHIFWDELFIFPILTTRLPELTRSLLRYRHRRLQVAVRAAKQAGFEGAMYPWQSGSDGREESQRLHLNPLSGRWMPDASHRQRHVGIAVAYTMWQYCESTGDWEFLANHGAEVILQIARFFASLATYDRSRDRYVIKAVMGPDEYHTGYPDAPYDGVDNNAYTNVMAVWVLRRALSVLSRLSTTRRTELTELLGLRPQHWARWEDIARRMFVPFHGDRVISQFEGYAGLAELDWERYRREHGDIQRLDRILEAEGDSVNCYQVSKQADVLMLFYLLSVDELAELFDGLGYRLEPDSVARTIDYYLARTSHGSTLSALVHAWVLARAGREQALDHFERVLESDVADIQGGTTAEGIHLAAMAGSVDLLQRCFAGLEAREDMLRFDPRWPAPLKLLRFGLLYRERRLTVRVSGSSIRVSADQGVGPPVRIACSGRIHDLGPGEAVEFSMPRS
jgi:alpha,alpha-trehalase